MTDDQPLQSRLFQVDASINCSRPRRIEMNEIADLSDLNTTLIPLCWNIQMRDSEQQKIL